MPMNSSKLSRSTRARRISNELSPEQAGALATMFRVLGDTNRLCLIYACLGDAVCVQDLASRLGLSSSLASHNLQILRAARLMRAERRGKRVFYAVDDEHIRDVLCDMITHLGENVGQNIRIPPEEPHRPPSHERAVADSRG